MTQETTTPPLQPVAYEFEYYNAMADEWVRTIRQTSESIPDPADDGIRDVTPLLPASSVMTALDDLRPLEDKRGTIDPVRAPTRHSSD